MGEKSNEKKNEFYRNNYRKLRNQGYHYICTYIDDDTFNILKAYRKKHGISQSEAIKAAINKLAEPELDQLKEMIKDEKEKCIAKYINDNTLIIECKDGKVSIVPLKLLSKFMSEHKNRIVLVPKH